MELYIINLSNYNEVLGFFAYMTDFGKQKNIKSMYKDGDFCTVEIFLHDNGLHILNQNGILASRI